MSGSAPSKTPREIAESHPFLGWLANMIHWGAQLVQDKDVLLDLTASKRFAVGLDDKMIVLGVQPREMTALKDIPWKTAALIRDFRGADWIALSCPDIRPDAATAAFNIDRDDQVPLRLFVRIAGSRADEIAAAMPTVLTLHPFKVGKSGALLPARDGSGISLAFSVRQPKAKAA